jgi:hypothetical protein
MILTVGVAGVPSGKSESIYVLIRVYRIDSDPPGGLFEVLLGVFQKLSSCFL